MATRRQLRIQVKLTETERDVAMARVRDLEKRLAAAGETHLLGSVREQRQADRILRLERDLKQARAAGPDVPREVAALRRQLAATQKQLDDATGNGDVGHAWPREDAPKPGVTA